jgi:hypothetical protein
MALWAAKKKVLGQLCPTLKEDRKQIWSMIGEDRVEV